MNAGTPAAIAPGVSVVGITRSLSAVISARCGAVNTGALGGPLLIGVTCAAAGVPAFIEKLLAEWASPDDRKPILAGLDAIEARSQTDYKVAGDKASPAQQDALLTLAMEDKLPGGKDFFEKFRQLVITGYFTSEVGITQEREYLPVPGRYDGAYLYSQVNKVFSS